MVSSVDTPAFPCVAGSIVDSTGALHVAFSEMHAPVSFSHKVWHPVLS